MIDTWGGWALFQELLAATKHVAEKHGASIPNVGTRYVLDLSEPTTQTPAKLAEARAVMDSIQIAP